MQTRIFSEEDTSFAKLLFQPKTIASDYVRHLQLCGVGDGSRITLLATGSIDG